MFRSKPRIDTLIVSDVHIGSEASRARDCHRLLTSFRKLPKHYALKRLILLGDIFDSMEMRRIQKWEWDFLTRIRKMAEPKSNVEVVWVHGNHDPEVQNLVPSLIGANAYADYRWQVGGQRFYATHGDQYDRWVYNTPDWLNRIPDWVYYAVQRIDGDEHRVSRYLKEQSREFLRLNDTISQGIIKHLKAKGIPVDVMIFGHTHIAEERFLPEEKVWYYNTGCWVGAEAPTYVTIDDTGKVELKTYRKPII